MSDSIFKNTGTNLRDVLASHDLGEILYTSIDVAKYNHSAMVVNFFGDVIIPKFDFPYNNHGINFLKKKIKTSQKQTQASKLFLGLESTGHYHENLVASLTASGYDVQVGPLHKNLGNLCKYNSKQTFKVRKGGGILEAISLSFLVYQTK